MNEPAPWWKGSRGEWYVVVQFLLFAVVLLGPKELPGLPRWAEPWKTVGLLVGLALGAAGGALGLAGIVSLGKNLTAVPHPKEDATLVQSGAYRLVRHPIYSGLILASLGWAFVNASTVAFLYALVLFVFFDVKSRREEKWLRQKFAGYAAYQQKVRKLIPFVY
ncbi:MAG: isoprenylcysteine carboxylmethyltransferase family protein [Chloroflexi bacterium]|nr:isoprenylcysteine carboxylmethyltransferase family protein [Chloroflexota bacterium]MCI0580039.1 isoprenylcysteine carboxylmethyltransferase family protein [Chloroflexota bacterium]MCI0646766.1 isoprenylcysteine carboxylmethyltransferase family protein [Chloroflexota bacterium]MCI0730206.1 isoprenylcysteine carboxylmethyltransferase family protein [Chloroflexota bacterium]